MPVSDNLLVRADAGAAIGAGHVMRCLALAQQWQTEGGRATFACSQLPEVLGERLRAEGCEVVMIDAVVGSTDDADATVGLARKLDAVVVADGYRFSVDYQEALYGNTRALLVLDDFGQIGSYRADIILDQNLGTKEATYVDRPKDCRLLLGPEYIMLRREFLEAERDRRELSPTVRRVLVTTGGSDVGGLAGTILEALEEIPGPLEITVVVGGAGSGVRVLEARVRGSHHRVRLIENATNMPELMAKADLAVSAAGSTVWELAYQGVPAVLGVVAENQRVGAAALERCGAAVTFEGTSSSAADQLRLVLGPVYGDQRRRSAMSEAGRKLVDGKGVTRVIRAMTRAQV